MRSWWWKLRRRLAVLQQLQSPSDWFLFLRVFVFAAAVPALLRLSLTRLEALLEPRSIPPPPEPARVRKIMGCVDAAIRFGRPLIRPTCLTRGVTAYTFLRRAGLDVSLCFGIGKAEKAVAAHCWLVVDGQPFMEANDPRPLFTSMYGFRQGQPASGILQPMAREWTGMG